MKARKWELIGGGSNTREEAIRKAKEFRAKGYKVQIRKAYGAYRVEGIHPDDQ